MNISNYQTELLQEIEELRIKMITMGLKKGLHHDDTIYISKHLDLLLNLYQTLSIQK
ncbi:aspartyl-phosphate phosphatase Spo0E family protein [Bacillus sp. SCS-151]|uniref:aspartyl-phosphate phosphatase Spo0E family protein n=1 Tax=Nanhaiella sioensis TaxID=3115293 RepID=UPI00397CEF02